MIFYSMSSDPPLFDDSETFLDNSLLILKAFGFAHISINIHPHPTKKLFFFQTKTRPLGLSQNSHASESFGILQARKNHNHHAYDIQRIPSKPKLFAPTKLWRFFGRIARGSRAQ
jgi:hypothetical protein